MYVVSIVFVAVYSIQHLSRSILMLVSLHLMNLVGFHSYLSIIFSQTTVYAKVC